MATRPDFMGTILIGGLLTVIGVFLVFVATRRTKKLGYQSRHLVQDFAGTLMAAHVEGPFIGGVIVFLFGFFLAVYGFVGQVD